MHDARMPDFEDRLERALVNELRRERRVRRAWQLSTVAGCSGAALFVVLAVGVTNDERLSPPSAQAHPYPAILYTAVAPAAPSDEEVGVRGAQTNRAREFAVGRFRGYVVPDAQGNWCISVPDLAANRPDVERGTSCARNSSELKRFGLSVRVGSVVAAAVPQGAPAPIRSSRGSSRRVALDSTGVAVVNDLQRGEKFSVFAVDGAARSHVNRDASQGLRLTCSDGRPVSKPSDCD